jgi:FkbM family methyltransferase
MNISKLSRLPRRIKNDLFIISNLKNWSNLLSCKLKGLDFDKLQFRNGLVLNSPKEVRLEMLFHEVWVEKMYSPKGFEVKDNDVVLDIGANIGIFSVFAATRAKNTKILSFEPFPGNVKWLKHNVEANKLKNIKIFDKAVAGENRKKTLYVSQAWVSNSLEKTDNKTNEIEIDCVTLENALQDIEVCNLMKIDCEGGEYEIFYSSSDKTLSKIQKIAGEYHNLDSNKMNFNSLSKFLSEKGFEITSSVDFGDGTGSFYAQNLKSI